jgi:hypothetical protein
MGAIVPGTVWGAVTAGCPGGASSATAITGAAKSRHTIINPMLIILFIVLPPVLISPFFRAITIFHEKRYLAHP